jgi:hypothetical protein
MVHFLPELIVSEVRLVSDSNKYHSFHVISFNLIPVNESGQPVLTEAPMPEIFLQ